MQSTAKRCRTTFAGRSSAGSFAARRFCGFSGGGGSSSGAVNACLPQRLVDASFVRTKLYSSGSTGNPACPILISAPKICARNSFFACGANGKEQRVNHLWVRSYSVVRSTRAKREEL